MITKVHTNRDGRILVAVVDSDLIGRRFEEGEMQLDLSSDFYTGKEMSPEETGDLIRNADMVNLVGKEAIALGIQEQVINPTNVKTLKGVPFAQGTTIRD
jgi:hypothetical protein